MFLTYSCMRRSIPDLLAAVRMSIEAPFAPEVAPTFDASIDVLVSRASSLYSLPAVAAEVLELTNNPRVDVRALKECILRDPALTAKLLRVVNSSLYGLSRKVSDLNQAIALMGIKPLKLLVLGFSLPEGLFVEVAREQLNWYWKITLTRAVAAREISEQLFKRPGDDAFIAGLMQDIGVLVLLGQLREPYAKLVSQVIENGSDLCEIESEALGFDHTTLSGALLEHWNMPRQLASAVAHVHQGPLAELVDTSTTNLLHVLQLANLVTELVGCHRLNVLPKLLKMGELYCGLDRPRLNLLIADLQPKVQQLAEVLSLELEDGLNYFEILSEAHGRVSEIVETVAGALDQGNWQAPQPATPPVETTELRHAFDHYLQKPEGGVVVAARTAHSLGIAKPQEDNCRGLMSPRSPGVVMATNFLQRLTGAVGQSRSQRQALSLMLLQLGAKSKLKQNQTELLNQVLEAACNQELWPHKFVEPGNEGQQIVVLPACDRQEAVRCFHEVLRHVERSVERMNWGDGPVEAVLSAGVAAVALPPRNFQPERLIQTAENCLAAALHSETNAVKSLEIY